MTATVDFNQLIFFRNHLGVVFYFKNDDSMISSVAQGKIWEQDIVLNHLSPIVKQSRVILDIGAHCGSHSLIYKKLNKNVKIFAFEPQSRMFELLKHNISYNKLDDVICFNVAVGETNGKSSLSDHCTDGINAFKQFDYGSDAIFNLGGVQIGSGGEEVDMIRIDDLNLDCCDFMKIDVEGYEPLVLEGSLNTITKFRPVIFFESNHKSFNHIRRSSFDILDSLGYSYRQVDDAGNFIAAFNQ